jgi:hypothetical protein
MFCFGKLSWCKDYFCTLFPLNSFRDKITLTAIRKSKRPESFVDYSDCCIFKHLNMLETSILFSCKFAEGIHSSSDLNSQFSEKVSGQ